MSKSMMRALKNNVMKYDDAEKRIREATSNDEGFCDTDLMTQIVTDIRDPMRYRSTLEMLAKRLQDFQHYNHVLKSLILIEFLLRHAEMDFVADMKAKVELFKKLKGYKYYDKDNKDMAADARKWAGIVVMLLENSEELVKRRADSRQKSPKKPVEEEEHKPADDQEEETPKKKAPKKKQVVEQEEEEEEEEEEAPKKKKASKKKQVEEVEEDEEEEEAPKKTQKKKPAPKKKESEEEEEEEEEDEEEEEEEEAPKKGKKKSAEQKKPAAAAASNGKVTGKATTDFDDFLLALDEAPKKPAGNNELLFQVGDAGAQKPAAANKKKDDNLDFLFQ